ncbi:LIC_13355 family lipoprotein [Turneriella parva]|uniref:Lipoprotein n=1 Tax=Turneriella parva (strain ATCC BAA-1111 / DSM 21527 / NCTC 11395 / H) TaxID=869212 RepID=I4B9B0_TURPD|nr:LIC_13355 family lipoprotein [Turneriella parva]AFM13867.1 lipoprotein [Turneriella parva DSM 21527]
MQNRISFLMVGSALIAFTVHCAQIEKEDTNSGNGNSNSVATSAAKPGVYLADQVVEAPGNTGTGFGNTNLVINGVRGSGLTAGGLDVYSLENTGATTHIVLAWNGKKVKNVAGADFAVYENAFNSTPGPGRFMEPMFAEVSNDNVNYCGFAPDFTNTPETTYSNDPGHWLRFAGKAPVVYNVTNSANNFTAAELFTDADADGEGDVGGGDLFDLDNLSDSNAFATGCTTPLRDELRSNGFRYLRLVSAARRINPDTGAAFVTDAISSGPDIDGAVARSVE